MSDVIVDPLLWFVHNQINIVNEETITKTVLDFYTEQEIQHSKELLSKAIRPRGRIVKRQGHKKNHTNVADILSLIHELDTAVPADSGPQIVTKDTHFPPLDIKDINATCFYHELFQLKKDFKVLKEDKTEEQQTLAKIAQQQQNLTKLVQAMAQLTEKFTGSSHEDAFGQHILKVSGRLHGQTPDNLPSTSKLTYATVLQSPAGGKRSLESPKQKRSTPAGATPHTKAIQPQIQSTSTQFVHNTSTVQKLTEEPPPDSTSHIGISEEIDPADDWQVSSSKKQKIKKSLHPDALQTVDRPVVLFASRLKPATTCQEIDNYVRQTFNAKEVECTKLATKYDSYASFKLHVKGVSLEYCLSPNNWPKGILIKKFYSARPQHSLPAERVYYNSAYYPRNG